MKIIASRWNQKNHAMNFGTCLFLRPKAILIAVCLLSLVRVGIVRGGESAGAIDYTERLEHARLFDDPLLWVGQSPPKPTESQELWDAFGIGRINSMDEAIPNLETFIKKHPASPWTPSLRSHLGEYYKEHGYFTPALDNWQMVWNATRNLTDSKGKQVADSTLANWMQLLASLGKVDVMRKLLEETKGRTFSKSLFSSLEQSRNAYSSMVEHPECSYNCGSRALGIVARVLGATNDLQAYDNYSSPLTGISLAALEKLAEKTHLDVVAVRRPKGNELVTPSVVHWKQNHYAAIVARDGNRYRVADPAFRMETWLTADAINSECTGEFIIPGGNIPSDWERMRQSEAAQVFGKGFPSDFSPPHGPPTNPCPCGGMPVWLVSEPFANVWLLDEPLGYQPSKGPRISDRIVYQQRNERQFDSSVFGFGANWNFSWLSYIDVSSYSKGTTNFLATLYVAGGGQRDYTVDGVTPEYFSRSRMAIITNASGLVACCVTYPSGAKDVYGLLQTNTYGNPRMAFRTQQIDPQGRSHLVCLWTL